MGHLQGELLSVRVQFKQNFSIFFTSPDLSGFTERSSSTKMTLNFGLISLPIQKSGSLEAVLSLARAQCSVKWCVLLTAFSE